MSTPEPSPPAAPSAASADSGPLPPFGFDNTYVRDLGDGFGVLQAPAAAPSPRLVHVDTTLAHALRLPDVATQPDTGAQIWSGNTLPPDAQPFAQVYAGHQFGGLSPRLGDGRALLVGELVDDRGVRRDVAFKGSGRTPFSRGGDGKAALGPMLREVLVSESMHALGIATTRALAVVTTGVPVLRDRALPGAVLTRVAASHLRVGTFQYFALRGDLSRLRRLLDYACARHDPDLLDREPAARALGLLERVTERQAVLIARWMNAGFIHGVMNTDNMTLSGETIDYGPCAFLEAYDPAAVFSSIDHQGRYAFGNQPGIAQWNLARFAEALLPLIADDPKQAIAPATERLDRFPALYEKHFLDGQLSRLGLSPGGPADAPLVADWLELLHEHHVDHTLAYRRLADAADDLLARNRDAAVRIDALRTLFGERPDAADPWLERWRERALRPDAASAPAPASGPARASAAASAAAAASAPTAAVASSPPTSAAMRAVNPLIIARNHHVEHALDAASGGDLEPFHALLDALRRPFDAALADSPFAQPAPARFTATYQTFCGT